VAQQRAGVVAQPVVDRLEPVRIDEAHREPRAALAGLAQPDLEAQPVRDAGQAVAVRQGRQPAILQEADDRRGTGLVAERARSAQDAGGVDPLDQPAGAVAHRTLGALAAFRLELPSGHADRSRRPITQTRPQPAALAATRTGSTAPLV